MIYLVKNGNNGPRCIEYRVYLITPISSFAIIGFKLERCTTCETWSIIVLVNCKTCPSVDKLLGNGRLLMWLTSSSTLFMNSLMLSPDPGTRDYDILILAARTTPLSVSSKLVSSGSSSVWMDSFANIGTNHFRASPRLLLHAFLREPWNYCDNGIDRVQISQLMMARTSWFQRGEHRQARA